MKNLHWTLWTLVSTLSACAAEDDSPASQPGESGESDESGAPGGLGSGTEDSGSSPGDTTSSAPDDAGLETTSDPATGSDTAAGTTEPGTSSDTGEPEIPGSIDVVVIGSSTAAGKNLDQPMYGGAPGNKPWAQLYGEYLDGLYPGSTVTNLAVSGTTTFEAMPTGTQNPDGFPAPDPEHNIDAAIDLDPEVVIVAYHLGSGAPTSQIMTNLATIVATAEAAGVEVWIGTPTPRPPTAPKMQLVQIPELHDAIMEAYGARAIDFTTPMLGRDGFANPKLMLTDDQHPNQAGHTVLFEAVVAVDIPGALAGGR